MKTGKCHICGSTAELTKEHVPPKSAFNKRTAIVYTGARLVQRLTSKNFPWEFSDVRGTQVQGGIGYETLCRSCNNNTGAWYGAAFADFTLQGLKPALTQSSGKTTTVIFKGIYPLRILKQAFCMFAAISNADFVANKVELQDFVLQKEKVGLDRKYKLYLYGCKGPLSRVYGGAARLSKPGSPANKLTVFSEIAAVPFGYVLQLPPESTLSDLVDISKFANYEYNEKIDFQIEIPVNEVNCDLPLDFRSKNQIKYDRDHQSL